MRLLDFIEQDDGKRPAPHRFSQLAWEKGDDTGRRLRAYQRLLQDMKWAGEYDGDTELKRVLPDGHTEPLWTRPPAR